MQTQTIDVTAAKAREFLSSNFQFEKGKSGTNRPVSIRTVNRYAISMLTGKWRLTHQGIAFDTKHQLKDGQHRLLALVQAAEEGATDGEHVYEPNPKIKIKFQVTYGLPEDVFDILDIGLARSSNQILAIAGYSNGSLLSASARLLFMFDEHEFKYWRSTKVTNQQVLNTVKLSNIDNYTTIGAQLRPIGFISAASTVGYYVCERAYPGGPHQKFMDDLKAGADLDRDSPALALRNYMMSSRSRSARIRRDAFVHLAMYIKAWNDYVENRRRATISWRTGEPFPTPIEK